ncbi:MAG: hypothetical protein WC632_02715 [Candidatus Margulisiibacteriota bacterium]
MNLERIARNMIRMVPVLALGLSTGCLPGKSGWQRFIEKTNTMIVAAGKKHGCVGRGEGEIEMDSMMGDYIAENIAKNNAYTDYKLRCVDPQALNVKIDKENGVIVGIMANGSLLNIRLFDCGRQNYFDPTGEKYISTVAVCGRKN